MKDILKLKASEARKISNKVYTNDFEVMLSRVHGASKLGKTQVSIDYEIDISTKRQLEDYGYDVFILHYSDGKDLSKMTKIGWFNSNLE